MVSFEENRFMLASALDQQVDRSGWIRAAIDVVAEEHMDRAHRADRVKISVDYGEHLLKQIGAAMDIADRVDHGLRPAVSAFGLLALIAKISASV